MADPKANIDTHLMLALNRILVANLEHFGVRFNTACPMNGNLNEKITMLVTFQGRQLRITQEVVDE